MPETIWYSQIGLYDLKEKEAVLIRQPLHHKEIYIHRIYCIILYDKENKGGRMRASSELRESRNTKGGFADDISIFFTASARATLRYLKNVPSKIRNYFVRKINERRNRPPRKDINKVYVLVGYTTRKHVDDKFNAERHMIILRRGLLIIIFVLLLFIILNRVLNIVKFDDMKQMFGMSGWEEVTASDPFHVADADPTDPSDIAESVATAVQGQK